MSRLLKQVREAVRTRHHSLRTEEAYLRGCVSRSFFAASAIRPSWGRRR